MLEIDRQNAGRGSSPCMGSTTPQCPCCACDVSRSTVLPSGLPDTVGASNLVISELTISGYPACMCPCPRLQVQPRDCPHMVRGQDGFAIPFPYDSFIHCSTPVYPDAIPNSDTSRHQLGTTA